MGISSDGQICFGIPFDEEYEFPWGEDIEGWWYRDICEYKPHPMPVEIVHHCAYDYPMFIIAAKGSFIRNSRGDYVEFDPKDLAIEDEEIATIINFCEKYLKPRNDYDKLPKMEPKWYLTSMYG